MKEGKNENILPTLFIVFKPQRKRTARKLKICIWECRNSDVLRQYFRYRGPITASQPDYTKNCMYICDTARGEV
jgi:hypothetical protein